MKKIISLVLVAVLMVLALASCSNISQSYADKINKAAENDKHYTYEDVKKDLGEDVVDITVTVIGSTNGTLIAVKGCDSVEDIHEKIDNDETVKGIVVVILNSKATSASYKELTKDDLK